MLADDRYGRDVTTMCEVTVTMAMTDDEGARSARARTAAPMAGWG